VHPVGKNSCKGGEDKYGDLTGKPDETQQKSGVRQAIHKPAHGYLLHPGPDKGNALAHKKESVISGTKGSSDKFEVCSFL
jgi:hypothetical protein